MGFWKAALASFTVTKWLGPILGDKKMSVDEDKTNAGQVYSAWVCPDCGKTVHLKRRYCNCHADLSRAKVMVSKEPPEIGPCNFESDSLNCNDCPEDCMWCASFGLPAINNDGFGGNDCLYKKKTVRCFCCQSQVKLSLEIDSVDLSELLRGVLAKKESGAANVYYKMADFIKAKMERPVLARIQQAREKAC
jgi:hypothetical protein